jgi:hypothetical protein
LNNALNNTLHLFLFDVDGVLVEARGYSQAMRSTVRFFSQKMGVDEKTLPGGEVYTFFEAHRISSEWDMVPLSLAVLLETILSINPDLELPADPNDLGSIRISNFPTEVDYYQVISALAPHIRVGEFPSTTALRLGEESSVRNPFPRLSLQPLFETLFSETREVTRSATTRIFQHYTLGSRSFEQTYQIPSSFETPSLLQIYDRPLLSQETRIELVRLQSLNRLRLTAYTLRPSLPPREVKPILKDYAPEAELALELVGLGNIPCIGYGQLQYLAEQMGERAEDLLKPSPFHAIVAIFVCLTKNELLSLEAAIQFYRKGNLIPPLKPYLDQPLSITIFEDSPGGIEAVLKASELLAKAGFSTDVSTFGIAFHPEKIAALERIGTRVFPDVESAVRMRLSRLQH